MPLDLDRLKKLVRLANNNPNENEANLAARRVCKMIEEADFKFGQTVKTSGGINLKDKPVTWEDVRRSTTPFWRPSPKQEAFWRAAYDPDKSRFYGGAAGGGKTVTEEEYRRRQQEKYEAVFDEDVYYQEHFKARTQTKQGHDKRTGKKYLTCTKCGQTRETEFVGLPERFVCVDCWSKP